MSNNKWGPYTWILFHTLSHKLKDEYFQEEKDKLFDIIKSICYNLPCPYCREHAKGIISKVSIGSIKSKEELKSFLFNFHNLVNNRLNKKAYNIEDLSKYNLANTYNVCQAFIKIYYLNSNNSRLLTDNFHRRKLINKFIEYYNTNKFKYNN